MAALTEQQKYLLGRIPNQYAFKTPDVVEPTEVKKARKVIAALGLAHHAGDHGSARTAGARDQRRGCCS